MAQIQIKYGENIFDIGIYSNGICLWCNNGTTSLGTIRFDNNTLFKDVYEYIGQRIKDYNDGIIHCSDCDKEMNYKEYGGRYFAGVYCKECWDREWKEREARETYN